MLTGMQLKHYGFIEKGLNNMNKETELLIRKNALKDVELWLYKQYNEIDKELV